MKKVSLIIGSIVIIAMLLSSFEVSTRSNTSVLVTPSTTVIIGNQEWMTENLNVDKFRNGDPIPEAKTKEEWEKAGENRQPAWCYYDNKAANGKKYGKLFNWYAVNDQRGIAPEGWHIPSDSEWETLTDFFGGLKIASTKMKSKSRWNKNGNGTNSSGFSGLPGGSCSNDGTFYGIGKDGSWWSSTEVDTGTAWGRYLYYFSDEVFRGNGFKFLGLSVRCLRD